MLARWNLVPAPVKLSTSLFESASASLKVIAFVDTPFPPAPAGVSSISTRENVFAAIGSAILY